jgi:hypothetical protein
MRYADFRNVIQKELSRNSSGLTWPQLKGRLHLAYERPCPEWIGRLEKEIGLSRTRAAGRAHIWRLKPPNRAHRGS